jgi:hypothetical protein
MPLNGVGSVEQKSRKPLTFWVSLTYVARIIRRVLPGVPEDDRQAHGSQAEADPAEVARAIEREDEGRDGVAPCGGSWILPVPFGAAERGTNEGVSYEVLHMWWWQLRWRSQRSRWSWGRFQEKLGHPIPEVEILHPYPEVRFASKHPR